MCTTTAEEKALLRKQVRDLLAHTPKEVLEAEDAQLFARLLILPQVEQAHTLFLFCGVGTEPDTTRLFAPLLAQGKRIALPRMRPGRQMEVREYRPDALVLHSFGIPEPDESCPLLRAEDIDLVLVPALCYDRQGLRLGMGGGYYDRWLVGYRGPTVGLCRQALLQEHLPAEVHDRPVDVVITPSEIIRTK